MKQSASNHWSSLPAGAQCMGIDRDPQQRSDVNSALSYLLEAPPQLSSFMCSLQGPFPSFSFLSGVVFKRLPPLRVFLSYKSFSTKEHSQLQSSNLAISIDCFPHLVTKQSAMSGFQKDIQEGEQFLEREGQQQGGGQQGGQQQSSGGGIAQSAEDNFVDQQVGLLSRHGPLNMTLESLGYPASVLSTMISRCYLT